MRAVNLIPQDQRRGTSRGERPVRSYVLIGGLAVLVLMASLYTLAGRKVTNRKADLARITAQADRAEARAGALAPYARFAALSQKRVETVKSLAESRFDWAHVMHELGRVIPSDAWLTSMTGTVSPNVAVDGASSQGGGLRGSLAGPAVEIIGCTTSQANVARMMSRMRLMDGVTRVALSASEKGASTGGATGGSSGDSGDCRHGNAHFPQFSMTVYFTQRPAASATSSSATTTPAAQTTSNGGTP